VNSRARVEAALAQQHLDRPPAAAWGHTYREEWSPEALAGVTIARQRRYEWDWVKFQPRASCFAEAFGAERVRGGHLWVYRSDVRGAEGAEGGSVVAVRDERGRFVARAC